MNPLNTPATPEQRWQALYVERTLADLFGPLRREVGEA